MSETDDPHPWSAPVRLAEIGRGGITLDLAPDGTARRSLAALLDLASLESLSASVSVTPWLDGAEVDGMWRAVVVQTCGVSLETFETGLEGAFTVRVVPHGSPNAPEPSLEVELDPEADDPPDVLDGDVVDVAAYVVEHFALEIDPFPRKPGVVFEPPSAEPEASPFAALAGLRQEVEPER